MNMGDTFYLRGPENPRPHLWIVISNPEFNSDEVLIANVTSGDKDPTCYIDNDEHPNIDRRSCIAYVRARIYSDEQLEQAKSIGALDPQTALSGDVLRRIQVRAAESEDLHNRYRQLLIGQNLCGDPPSPT